MKKIYVSIVMLFAVLSTAFAVDPEKTDLPNAYGEQLWNSTFDGAWQTTDNEPVNMPNGGGWHSFNTAQFDGTSAKTTAQFGASNDIIRPGSAANAQSAKVNARYVLVTTANGNATTGQIYANVGLLTSSADSRNLTKCFNRTVRADNKFNTPFESKPDSVAVWVNFQPINTTNQLGRISIFIHGDADFQDPPSTQALRNQVVAFAGDEFLGTNGWVRLSIPFQYDSYESFTNFTNSTLANNRTTYPTANVEPKYIIATTATNNVPGGDRDDILYVDDFLMIYNPTLTLGELSFEDKVLVQGKNYGTVSYTLTGTMSPYNLNEGKNAVIAELSDANGNFDNPTEIGRTVSDVSGVIEITIPGGVPFGTGYKIRVRSTNYPMIAEGTIDGFTVLSPEALPATDITQTSITANWKDLAVTYGNTPEGFTGYRIAVFNVNNVQIGEIQSAGTDAISIAVGNLEPSTFYYYTVSAVIDGFISYGKKIEFITAGPQIITWEQALTVDMDATLPLTATVSSNLPITYTSSDETIVKVVDNVLVPVSVGEAVITALQPGDGVGILPASETRTATVIPAAPAPSTNNPNNDTNSTANWKAANGAISYNVQLYLSEDNTPIGELVAGIEELSLEFTELSEGTAYYYTVTAVNGKFQSAAARHDFTTRKNQVIMWEDKWAPMNTGTGNGNVTYSSNTAPSASSGLTAFTFSKITSNLGGTTAVTATNINVGSRVVGQETVKATQAGNAEWMPASTTITVTVHPTNPGGTAATSANTTGTSFTIGTWNALPANVDAFVIYQSADGGEFEFVANIGNVRTYSFADLTPNTEYVTRIYTVKAGTPEGDYLSRTFLTNTTTTPMLYSISYQGVEASEHNNPASYTPATPTITLNPAADRGENTFEGWFTDIEYTNEITEIELGTTGNITLYAKWSIEEKFTITYNNVFGTENNNPAEYLSYSEFSLLDLGQRTGYTFEGWFTDAEREQAISGITRETVGNLELYAKWDLITYNIAYNNVEGADNENPATFTIESSFDLLPLGERAGYTFEGWFTDAEFEQPISGITEGMTGDLELYAQWDLIPTYLVTVISEATDATGAGNYKAGETVTIFAGTAPAGMQFKEWTVEPPSVVFIILTNITTTTTAFIMPAEEVTVTAVFEAIPTYSVTVISEATDAIGAGNYKAGETVTIFAGTAPEGKQFKNWTIEPEGVEVADAESETITFIMPAEAVTVTAIFEPVTTVETIAGAVITVYPNPVSTIVYISGVDVKKAVIYTAQGVKITEEQIVDGGINVASFQNGVYVIEIEAKDGKTYKQLFVKK
ncbi:MAG: InlB B-repeat-containing protein [Bacteroidetes bacterium]|nr:InlB B-repeat-containing protein [Bacteroidota bacterium]